MPFLAIFIVAFCCQSAAAQFANRVDVPPDLGNFFTVPSNTQVNINSGGTVGRNFTVGPSSDGESTEVNVFGGGHVEGNLSVFSGAVINFLGGTAEGNKTIYNGGELNLEAGFVGGSLFTRSGSLIRVSGGTLDGSRSFLNPNISSGSRLEISGGSVGDRLVVSGGGELVVSGGDFRLNGTLLSGLVEIGTSEVVDLSIDDVLSGNLADGTPFAFTGRSSDNFAAGTLTLRRSEVVPTDSSDLNLVVNAPSNRLGVRNGQTIRVEPSGAVGPHFNAGRGSAVHVAGGSIGRNLEAVDARVTVSGGNVGSRMDAFGSSRLEVSAGRVGSLLGLYDESSLTISEGGFVDEQATAFGGTQVEMLGGTIASSFTARGTSYVSLSSGIVGSQLSAHDHAQVLAKGNVSVGNQATLSGQSRLVISDAATVGSDLEVGSDASVRMLTGGIGPSLEVTGFVAICGGDVGVNAQIRDGGFFSLSGGTVGDGFDAYAGSHVNLVGYRFFEDGVDITDSLEPNVPIEFPRRNVTLSGNLASRSDFSFDLNTTNEFDEDYFDNQATLTLTLVLPGDYNLDGVVDAADYTVWRDSNGEEGQGLHADGNFDRVVDDADYSIWTRWYGEVSPRRARAIPEPQSTVTLLVSGTGWSAFRRIRRRKEPDDAAHRCKSQAQDQLHRVRP